MLSLHPASSGVAVYGIVLQTRPRRGPVQWSDLLGLFQSLTKFIVCLDIKTSGKLG